MKYSIALIAVLAQVASATFGLGLGHGHLDPKPVCGTTTITEVCKTATKTSYSHYPTVTETITRKKNACEVTSAKTKTAIQTTTVKVTVDPTITSTIQGPKKTVTASACIATVTSCPPKHYKRHFLEERLDGSEDVEAVSEGDEEVEVEEVVDEYAGLTNAERIRRGLPLAKPVDKRTFCLGGYWLGGKCHQQPPKAGPSCVPKTIKVESTKTITQSVTPTQFVTSTKCGYTHTVQSTVYTTSLKTETKTKTGQGHCTTVFSTVTPTQTKTVHFTTTVCNRK